MPTNPNIIRIKKYFFLLLMLSITVSFSQERTNHWYFGTQAGLDFSAGNPVSISNSALASIEACGSIADDSGNLLFYTDGIRVWDANNNVMPNGSGLLGNESTAQLIIIPKPLFPNIYYIIYGDNQGGANGLRFSEVDMTLNNGNGDIVVNSKNTLLHNNSSEKIAAVFHCNGTDVWLMTMNYVQNQFYAYLVTDTGIQAPVISPAASLNDGCCQLLKFSPNGSWIAHTIYGGGGYEDSKLYEFNALTGNVTFHSDLTLTYNSWQYMYGISFSPDNSRLYFSGEFRNNGTVGTTSILYQYDMTATDINASKTVIYSQNFSGANVGDYHFFGGLQNAKDGKIYLAKRGADHLGIINNPNALGVSCNFTPNGISLGGNLSEIGIPNFIESYFDDNSSITCDELYVEEYIKPTIKIYPNPAANEVNIALNNFEEQVQIRIYSVLGTLVYAHKYSNSNYINLEISDLEKGVYFLEIKIKNNSNSYTIIKN